MMMLLYQTIKTVIKLLTLADVVVITGGFAGASWRAMLREEWWGERFLLFSRRHSSRGFAAVFRGAACSAPRKPTENPHRNRQLRRPACFMFITFSSYFLFLCWVTPHTILHDREHSPSVFAACYVTLAYVKNKFCYSWRKALHYR